MPRALVMALALLAVGVPVDAQVPATCDGTFHRAHLQEGPNRLAAMDFSGPGDGWAVGFQYDSAEGGPEYPLVVHHDGESWSEFPAPARQRAGDVDLDEVSALRPDLVWVAAQRWLHHRSRLYIRVWDGASWTDPRPPGLGGRRADRWGGVFVTDVEVLADDDAWVVGVVNRDDVNRGFALHYDDTVWRSYDVDGYLEDVEASPSGELWGLTGRRVLRFDGTRWTRVRLPDHVWTRRHAGFRAVHVVDDGEIWFLGRGERRGGNGWLTLRWLEGAWEVHRLPGVEEPESYADVDGAGDDLWAVGEVITGEARSRARALRWDGQRWNEVPVEGALGGFAGGVEVPQPGDAWALADDVLLHACDG